MHTYYFELDAEVKRQMTQCPGAWSMAEKLKKMQDDLQLAKTPKAGGHARAHTHRNMHACTRAHAHTGHMNAHV